MKYLRRGEQANRLYRGYRAYKGMFFIIRHLGVGSVGRGGSVGREIAFFLYQKAQSIRDSIPNRSDRSKGGGPPHPDGGPKCRGDFALSPLQI